MPPGDIWTRFFVKQNALQVSFLDGKQAQQACLNQMRRKQILMSNLICM